MSKPNKKEKPAHLVARAKPKFTVYPVKESGELLDFLMKVKDGISRTTAKSLLTKRQVYVDNVITTQYNYALKLGMKVQVSREKGKKEFNSRFLKIVYEDAYLLIVNKREGLLTATNEKQRERSAHTILTEYVQKSGKQNRVYTVNKLDREISGLVIFAKDEKTKINLQDHWNDVVKTHRYVGILSGEMEKENGAVTSWLNNGKIYFSHSTMSNRDGEKAVTRYKTIKRANGYTLVEFETGWKNQIRAHMEELQHPLLGDDRFDNGNDPLKRLALHSFKFSFYHPVTRQLIELETPYPDAFKKLMQKTVIK